MVLWQHVVLCGWCFRICYDRSSPCLSVSSSVLYGIGILNECILIQHARWKTKKKICNYLRLLLTSNNASEEIWPLSARALCVWLPHLLIPVGLTMEVRAISSAISAVRCRWCMFLSCPLKLQRGAAKRLVISTDHFCVCMHIYIYIYIYICIYIYIYGMSQEECARLRESVPYVKVYRYNPKHLCPKLNGYGDNGQRNLKIWQLLHTYWLPNTY